MVGIPTRSAHSTFIARSSMNRALLRVALSDIQGQAIYLFVGLSDTQVTGAEEH